VSDRDSKIGVNEALFREVNERIDELRETLGQGASFEVVCECGNPSCIERFTIDAHDYANLRGDVHRFAVIPGHELPDVEQTVEQHEHYLVVEKTDPEAAHAAEELA
jgi:hypothetical protein